MGDVFGGHHPGLQVFDCFLGNGWGFFGVGETAGGGGFGGTAGREVYVHVFLLDNWLESNGTGILLVWLQYGKRWKNDD